MRRIVPVALAGLLALVVAGSALAASYTYSDHFFTSNRTFVTTNAAGDLSVSATFATKTASTYDVAIAEYPSGYACLSTITGSSGTVGCAIVAAPAATYAIWFWNVNGYSGSGGPTKVTVTVTGNLVP